MDTDAEYRKMRAQLDELDRRLAQWQSATQPIVMPRSHVDHARFDRSLNAYQRPGRLPQADPDYMPLSPPMTVGQMIHDESLREWMGTQQMSPAEEARRMANARKGPY